MGFCPSCGSELSAGAKFCPSCGSSISSVGYVQQQVTKLMEEKIKTNQEGKSIGVFKQLENDEKLVTNSTVQAEVIFVKEAEIKKVLGKERKEVPLSMSSSMFYLTSQRLLFLKLFEVWASDLQKEDKKGVKRIAGAGGTFFELPLTAIAGVEMRQVKLNKNDKDRFMEFFGNESLLDRPTLEIIYDEKAATGRAKDYVESMLDRNKLSKLWGKVEMVYDKILVLGEQAVVLQPLLSDYVKMKSGMR
jgi:hypothetical protein